MKKDLIKVVIYLLVALLMLYFAIINLVNRNIFRGVIEIAIAFLNFIELYGLLKGHEKDKKKLEIFFLK